MTTTSSSPGAAEASTVYTARLPIAAPAETVFDILTMVTAFASWWAPAVGAAAEGGDVTVDFGLPEPLRLHVQRATRPSAVSWKVTSCSFLPDWIGTSPTFTLTPAGASACELHFRHEGLHDGLECYLDCKAGWDQYLPSLRDYIETGSGKPFQGVARVMHEQHGS